MSTHLSVPADKKLNVLFRIEPGCMGPAGIDHINEFCEFAQDRVAQLDAGYVSWHIVARTNKQLPEMEFSVGSKQLSDEQAARYLQLFGRDFDTFELELHECLAGLVDEFWQNDESRGAST